MRLLAFSDLHLGAPIAEGGKELADLRRAELVRTLQRTAELARRLEVEALLCAGDLYEQERFTPDTVRLLERIFEELAPIPVLISPGNHDWYGPKSLYRAAKWSNNVHIFESSEMTPWDGLDGFRIWGFAHRAPSGTSNPLEGFSVVGAAVHLGLFHGSENSGWPWAKEYDEGKQPHAPFEADQIEETGLAHCVVGHYHRRVEGERHTYGGAPAPLSFGEPGNGGAVEFVFDNAGELVTRKWHRVSELELHDKRLDITGCDDSLAIEQRLDMLVEGLSGIARVTLMGEQSPDVDLNLTVLGGRKGGLEHLSLRIGEIISGYDLERIRHESSVEAEFVRSVEADTELEELGSEIRRRVIVTGLRALSGRDDLEVP